MKKQNLCSGHNKAVRPHSIPPVLLSTREFARFERWIMSENLKIFWAAKEGGTE